MQVADWSYYVEIEHRFLDYTHQEDPVDTPLSKKKIK